MDSGYLFLETVSLLLGLLKLRLKLSDLGNVAGGLKKTRADIRCFRQGQSEAARAGLHT